MRFRAASSSVVGLAVICASLCLPASAANNLPVPSLNKTATVQPLPANSPLRSLQAASASKQQGKSARSPFDRYLLPSFQKYMQAHPKSSAQGKSGSAAARALNAKSTVSAHTSAESAAAYPYSALASPNFGGFYAAPHVSTTGNYPYSDNSYSTVFAGDFNHDGHLDVVAVDVSGNIWTMLNDGNGGFAPGVGSNLYYEPDGTVNPNYVPQTAGESSAFWSNSADLNGDGYPDLVVGNWLCDFWGIPGNCGFSVFLNAADGSGTFKNGMTYRVLPTTGGAGTFSASTLADVNGDDSPDVIAVSMASSNTATQIEVQSYLNKGNGTFGTARIPETDFMVSGYVYVPFNGVQTAMVNGKLTLFIEVYSGTDEGSQVGIINTSASVLVLTSNGDGTFNKSSMRTVTFPVFPQELGSAFQIGDLNNDGIPDMVLAGGDGTLWTAVGNADGSYQAPLQVITGDAVYPQNIVLADANGDGYLDLIDTEETGSNIWIGHGDGTFSFSGSYATGYHLLQDGDLFAQAATTAVGDFNGDGKIDFVTQSNYFNYLSLYTGNGDGTFQGAPYLANTASQLALPDYFEVLASLDLNGDGKTDVVAEEVNGNSYTLESGISDGKGHFTYKAALPADAYTKMVDWLWVPPQTGDFNRDGRQDIILYSVDEQSYYHVWVALSNGDGTFQEPVEVNLSTHQPLSEPANVAVGDVNNDGIPDLVIAYLGNAGGSEFVTGTSGYYVALGNGDGTFKPAQYVSDQTLTAANMLNFPFDQQWKPLLADLNGDGNLDMVISSLDGGIQVLLGDGTGNFNPQNPLGGYVYASVDYAPMIFLSDLTGSGAIDMVAFSVDPGGANDQDGLYPAIEVYSGVGDGTFNLPNYIVDGLWGYAGAVADFNGDGVPDILVDNYASYTMGSTYPGVSVLLGHGDRSFADPVSYISVPENYWAFTGDYNGDGTLGVIIGDDLGGYITGDMLLLNEGGSTLSLQATQNVLTFGSSTTLLASVTTTFSGNQSTASGTIAFFENGAMVDSETLSNGQASFTPSELAVGSHVYTARYSGGGNLNPNVNSPTVNVVVASLPPAVTASILPGSLTLQHGQTGFVTINVSGNATYSGNVTFACQGLPVDVGCTFTPSTLAVTPNQQATATLGITTTASQLAHVGYVPGISAFAVAAPLVACVLLWIPFRRRRFFWTLLPLVVMGALLGISGCGSSSSTPTVQTAKATTATITVTVTPSVSGVPVQTQNINLTIQ